MKISLHKNGWHSRLQAYVFGTSRGLDTTNLCPYFWLTIACLIALTPVALFKGVRGFFRLTDDFINWCGEVLEAGFHKAVGVRLDTWLLRRMPAAWVMESYKLQKYSDRYTRWQKAVGDDYAKIFKEMQELYAKEQNLREERERRKRLKQQKSRQRMMFWSNLTRKVVPFVGLALVLLAIGLLGVIVLQLWQEYEIDWQMFWTVMKAIGFITACFVTGYLLFCILAFFFKGLRKLMGGYWSTATEKFDSGFGLFWGFFTGVKNDYCPEIEWKE